MPRSVWKGIDEKAEEKCLSANQVIRKVLTSWLSGTLIDRLVNDSPIWTAEYKKKFHAGLNERQFMILKSRIKSTKTRAHERRHYGR